MKIAHLTDANRAALRTLRDVGVIRATGPARARFNDLVFLGYANGSYISNGVVDYRLNHGGKTIAGVIR